MLRKIEKTTLHGWFFIANFFGVVKFTLKVGSKSVKFAN